MKQKNFKNNDGIALMRKDLPFDCQKHFDDFVAMASENDYSIKPRIWKNIRITQKSEDGRVLLLRAFLTDHSIGIHARVYLKGTYGVLFHENDNKPLGSKNFNSI